MCCLTLSIYRNTFLFKDVLFDTTVTFYASFQYLEPASLSNISFGGLKRSFMRWLHKTSDSDTNIWLNQRPGRDRSERVQIENTEKKRMWIYPEISRKIFSPHNSTQIFLRMWKKIKCDNLLFSWFLLSPIAMQSLKSEVGGPFEFPFYSKTFLWCRTSRKIMFRCPGKVVLD